MKKNKLIVLIFLMLVAFIPATGRMQNEAPNRQYYQFMVFRMTEELALTEKQAEQFFPLHREYQQQKHQLYNEMASLSKEAYEKNNISKSDLNRYKNEVKRLKNAETELDAAFYAKIETFLNPGQVVRFVFFDQHFRRELSRELKERYPDPQDQKKQPRPKRNK